MTTFFQSTLCWRCGGIGEYFGYNPAKGINAFMLCHCQKRYEAEENEAVSLQERIDNKDCDE